MAKKHVFALLAALSISAPVFAADTGGYLVGMVGQTKFKDVDTGGLANVSVDKTDVGIKLGGGYAFHRNFGVEAAYVDLGKATASAGGQTAEAKASGPEVVAVLMLPIGNQVTLLGRLGVIDATVKISGPGGSDKATKVKTTFGIGATYSFTPKFAVRADYDVYKNLGDNATTGESDVDMISVGVVFKF
jgi:OOP family OmpA-OmpF porin